MHTRLTTDGKFFQSGGRRIWLKVVTYGPFPGGWAEDLDGDFRRISAAGFNALRLYDMPEQRLLDAAWRHGLRVFGGLRWGQHADFLRNPGLLTGARVSLAGALAETAGHPALAGVLVGNEIPADLVRWMGPVRVREAVEGLITLGRDLAPGLCFAYANYPSTEYLEPENADFSAFNVYLEDQEAFRKYLRRLHHIAGDRPLVITEFGLDSYRNGPGRQAEILSWAVEVAREEQTAGMTIYAWSDRWWNAGAEVLDWDFGLVDRDGLEKPALRAVAEVLGRVEETPDAAGTMAASVIVCTRNGRDRIGSCLRAVAALEGGGGVFREAIVVDDGSEDGTADFVERNFPDMKLIRLEACGLSAARNAGAAAASGEVLAYTDDDCEPDREWLIRLMRVFSDARFAAAGGPNLAPAARTWREAVVRAAPGAPSHVMLDDEEAEHLPGCNLAVTRAAFDAVGGFDPQFRTAGDDVDFCWRLRDAGFRLGFSPGAFVWHWRRPTLRAFLRQQRGYGLAENRLREKHPERFSAHGCAKWEGFVYGGGPVRVMEDSIIYHGPMGSAGYQSVSNRMLPLRGLDRRFNDFRPRLALWWICSLVPAVRSWSRSRSVFPRFFSRRKTARDEVPAMETTVNGADRWAMLEHFMAAGWKPGDAHAAWDLEMDGARVLMATERGDRGAVRTLLRVWGGTSQVQRALGAPDCPGKPDFK